MIHFATGLQVNLLRFNLQNLQWTDLTDQTTGLTPIPRGYHGFAESDGLLYVFGGYYAFSFKC